MIDIEEVQERLKDRNLSELASRVGLTRSYLTALKNGKRVNPTLETLKKILRELDADDE